LTNLEVQTMVLVRNMVCNLISVKPGFFSIIDDNRPCNSAVRVPSLHEEELLFGSKIGLAK
jgi:hypothetical protein